MAPWFKKFKTNERPWFLELRSSQTFIVFTVSLSMFTDLFLYAMIVPVMPRALVTRAGVSFEDREYWNSVMLVSEAVSALACSPVFGYVMDRSGTRQGPYLFGLGLLFASMAVLTLARSIIWYIIARVLQGAATAMVAVAGLAIVTDTVDRNYLGHMIGYIGTSMNLGFMTGPMLGGLVYHVGGFYSVFGMAFAIVGLDFLLRLAVIEKRIAQTWLTPASSETASEEGWVGYAPYGVVGRNLNKGVSSQTFAFWKLLRQPRILISLWAVIAGALVISAFDTTLPIFVENTFHWNALGAGMIFLSTASAAIFQPFFGYLSDRLGARVLTFTSFILLAPSLICLRLVEDNTMQHKEILCAILVLVGMCLDLSEPALLVEIQRVLDYMEEVRPGIFGEKGAVAQGFSLVNMAHFGGLALGPMLGGFIDQRYGWKAMTLALGILSAVTAVPMLWLDGGPLDEELAREDSEREPLLE